MVNFWGNFGYSFGGGGCCRPKMYSGCCDSFGYNSFMYNPYVNSYFANPFGGFSAGPSYVNLGFRGGEMLFGPNYMYGGCGGYRGYNSGFDRVLSGFFGTTQVLNGLDNISYALR